MRLNRVRMATILAIVMVTAVAAVGWFAVLGPRTSEADQLMMEASDTELANIKLLRQQRDLLGLADQAPAKAAEAQRLFAAMPQQAELPEVIDQITQAALDAGIPPADITVINTGIPAPVTPDQPTTADAATSLGVNLATMKVDIVVAGSRESLLDFVDRLQGLDRALLIQSTAITAAPDNAPSEAETMTVTGSMFVLQSSLPDLVAGAREVVAQAQAEAAATAP